MNKYFITIFFIPCIIINTITPDDQPKNVRRVINPYDEAIDILAGYFQEFDQNADNKCKNFLKKELSAYPSAADRTGYVANEDMQQAWIYGTDKFKETGFKPYTSKMNTLFDTYIQNPIKATKALEAIDKLIPLMNADDIKKIAQNTDIAQIKDRIEAYQTEFNKTIEIIKTRVHENKDPWKTFLSFPNLPTYELLHNQFEQTLNNFKTTLANAQEAGISLQKTAQRWEDKNKENA